MEKISDYLNRKRWQPKPSNTLDGLPIRPSVKRTRLYLDNEYFEKGYAAAFPHSVTTVYCILAKHANHKKQTCFPSGETIMRLAGTKNRNTVFVALKILEAYNIIAIAHGRSKGRVPNEYALIAPSHWRSLGGIPFDTVAGSTKKERTVSINNAQQYQNLSPNSINDDTRSHLMDSDKEIRFENKEEKKAEPIKGGIPKCNLITLSAYFEESDTLAAYLELQNKGVANPSFSALKELLQRQARDGTIKQKKQINW